LLSLARARLRPPAAATAEPPLAPPAGDGRPPPRPRRPISSPARRASPTAGPDSGRHPGSNAMALQPSAAHPARRAHESHAHRPPPPPPLTTSPTASRSAPLDLPHHRRRRRLGVLSSGRRVWSGACLATSAAGRPAAARHAGPRDPRAPSIPPSLPPPQPRAAHRSISPITDADAGSAFSRADECGAVRVSRAWPPAGLLLLLRHPAHESHAHRPSAHLHPHCLAQPTPRAPPSPTPLVLGQTTRRVLSPRSGKLRISQGSARPPPSTLSRRRHARTAVRARALLLTLHLLPRSLPHQPATPPPGPPPAPVSESLKTRFFARPAPRADKHALAARQGPRAAAMLFVSTIKGGGSGAGSNPEVSERPTFASRPRPSAPLSHHFRPPSHTPTVRFDVPFG
jgi:hypothetical protein